MTTILIVDDDRQFNNLLCQCIEKEGYSSVTAADGNEAIKLALIHHPSLVITDILMPDKEGLDTIRELRRIAPETKIIAISGGGEITADLYLKMAKSLGAHHTLEKPFARGELLDTIALLLSNSGRDAP